MLLSQRKYAEHRKTLGLRGGSLGAVQKALAAGRIQLTDGLVDSDAADAAWGENTNPAKVREPQTSAKRDSASVADQQLELLTEKTLTARTKRLQLEGEVILAAHAEQAFGELVDTAKNLLLRVPDDLAERLAASKEPAECRSILVHEIRQALMGLEKELAA